MISNSLGDCLGSVAIAFVRRFVAERECAPGRGWWEMAVGVGDLIAPRIGAGPANSLHQNVTLTQA